jgi:hypothetical protein
MGWHGPPRRPANVWGVAFCEGRPPIVLEEFRRYRERVAAYAREPVPLGRRLRYGLGRWLCGRRPFAPYLELENWETECRTH